MRFGGYQRLSPGIYRGPNGQTVRSATNPGMMRPQGGRLQPFEGAAGGMHTMPFPVDRVTPENAGQFQAPLGRQTGGGQMAPQDGQMYMGGSPNFNENMGRLGRTAMPMRSRQNKNPDKLAMALGGM